jgi:hypothetical protein
MGTAKAETDTRLVQYEDILTPLQYRTWSTCPSSICLKAGHRFANTGLLPHPQPQRTKLNSKDSFGPYKLDTQERSKLCLLGTCLSPSCQTIETVLFL